MDIQTIMRELVSGQTLDEERAHWLFEQILSGNVDDAQIGSVLTAISARVGEGPTTDELVGGTRAMRAHLKPVKIPDACTQRHAAVIDTCGTGGAPKTFNISTAAAIVVAAAGNGQIVVAKHGSKSRTGRGSSEVMSALGVNIDAPPDVQSTCLEQLGLCFSFAIQHHPAMKHAAGPRKSLGFPTIFNLLGPLCNPAGARRQLVGTYDRTLAQKLAETLARVGAERALVVTSHDGFDEFTTTNTNLVYSVEDGAITTHVIEPAKYGFERPSIDDLRVTTLDDAAQAVRDVIDGNPGPKLDIVLLNAGAAIVVAGFAEAIGDAIEIAREAVTSGAARTTLDELVRLTNV